MNSCISLVLHLGDMPNMKLLNLLIEWNDTLYLHVYIFVDSKAFAHMVLIWVYSLTYWISLVPLKCTFSDSFSWILHSDENKFLGNILNFAVSIFFTQLSKSLLLAAIIRSSTQNSEQNLSHWGSHVTFCSSFYLTILNHAVTCSVYRLVYLHFRSFWLFHVNLSQLEHANRPFYIHLVEVKILLCCHFH